MFAKYKRFLVPVVIIVAAIAVFVMLKATKPEQKQVDIVEKVWMVDAINAQFETLAPMQTLYGTVESNSLVTAAAPVSGVVEKVLVKEGQTVTKGDMLFAMSEADLDIPYTQVKADLALQKLTNQANVKRLAHEQSVLKLKQVAVTRAKQLMQKNLASKSSLDSAEEALVKQEYVVVGAKLAVQQNAANLAKAQAAFEQAQTNKQRGQLIAPYNARIASVNVAAGSRVNAGATLVQFYALESLELRAKLPLEQTANIQTALSQGQDLMASYQTAGSEYALPLLRLAGIADTSGVDAFFKVPARLSQKRPGELLSVRLKGLKQENVIAVPYSAIYGNDRIYIIEKQRLQAKTVQMVGEVTKDGKLWALIRADIKPGTKISTTHLPNAVTGLKVKESK